MTIQEKNNLYKNFNDLWIDLWGNFKGLQYTNEEKNSKIKFETIKEGINSNDEIYNINDLIEKSTTNWVCPEWGFPKGRRNYQENDIKCANREFIEETGFRESDYDILKNVLPYEEIFMGSNFKSYKHKYYIGFMVNFNNLQSYQRSEVSKMKWVDLEECIKIIRPYNIEKKEIIKRIDKVLHKYSLFS